VAKDGQKPAEVNGRHVGVAFGFADAGDLLAASAAAAAASSAAADAAGRASASAGASGTAAVGAAGTTARAVGVAPEKPSKTESNLVKPSKT